MLLFKYFLTVTFQKNFDGFFIHFFLLQFFVCLSICLLFYVSSEYPAVHCILHQPCLNSQEQQKSEWKRIKLCKENYFKTLISLLLVDWIPLLSISLYFPHFSASFLLLAAFHLFIFFLFARSYRAIEDWDAWKIYS